VPQKRLRIFAGPNGSGKSSLLERIPDSVPLGYYINADEIEKQIASNVGISLSIYGISSNNEIMYRFLENSDFVKIKSDLETMHNTFIIINNVLKTKTGSL
jgi:predicted ABC-type ATPase